ncbi:MAG TPA: DUF308 domain-containing protein [Candidatus Brevibacterium intestinigallinarum]|nr:DUF308 domain-containing protein [Candidatus Brevibacterium intestinigallinarum]
MSQMPMSGGLPSAGGPDPITTMFKRLRVSFMVQGGFSIVAGILFLVWPFQSATAFVLVFAAWLLASAIVSAILTVVRKQGSLLGTLVPGVLGLLLLVIPEAAGSALVFLVAFASLLVGGLSVALSLSLRRVGFSAWWLTLIAGVLAVAYGFLALFNPTAALAGLLWALGLLLVIIGVAIMVLGWRIGSMSLNGAGGATFGTPGSGGPGFGGTGFGGPGFGGPQMPPRRGPDDDVIPGEEV